MTTSATQFRELGSDNQSTHHDMQLPPRNIDITGSGNHLELSSDANLSLFDFRIKGNNNRVIINSGTSLRGMVYIRGEGCTLEVGAETTAIGVRFTLGDGGSIRVGRDCMFSRNVEVRSWDEHPIFDLETRRKINRGKDVILADHIWVGEGVTINKGAVIAPGSVIGARSLVAKSLPEPNAIYVGVPAKIVRRRIVWARGPRQVDWETFDYSTPTPG